MHPRIKELIAGPIAAVPTAFTAAYEVDCGRMEVATEQWIDGGLVEGRSVLKVGASIGEGQLLREAEWARLLETVVGAARGRVPVIGAIHHKDTVRALEDIRRAGDLGATAVQISPPIFNLPTQEDILRHFGAISAAAQIGIIVYVTNPLRHGSVMPETLARMADFEKVVAIKWAPPADVAYDAVFGLADRFNILDNSGQPARCHRLGGRGYMVDGIEAWPPFWLRLWDLLEAGEYDAADRRWHLFADSFGPYFTRVLSRSGSDGRAAKGMARIMGLDLGPHRPPSLPLDDAELAELRELMIRWGWPVPGAEPVPERVEG